jgi:hypothetical protein
MSHVLKQHTSKQQSNNNNNKWKNQGGGPATVRRLAKQRCHGVVPAVFEPVAAGGSLANSPAVDSFWCGAANLTASSPITGGTVGGPKVKIFTFPQADKGCESRHILFA